MNLSVIIKNILTITYHVNNAIRKSDCVKFSLYPLINQRNPLEIKTNLYIYNTYIRPILMYAGPT